MAPVFETSIASRFISRDLLWILVAIVLYLTPNVYCICQNGDLIVPSGREPAISQDFKDLIVRVHNLHRSCVALQDKQPYCAQYGTGGNQPGARYMLEMVWDDALGNLAQNEMNKCLIGPNDSSNLTNLHPDFPDQLGSNMMIMKSSQGKMDIYAEAPWEKVMDKWFDGHKSYTYQPLANDCSNICFYTQMIAANTHKIGCGYSYFKERSQSALPYVEMFTCYYGPSGNIVGGTPYSRGAPICKNQLEEGSYPGLCKIKSGYKL